MYSIHFSVDKPYDRVVVACNVVFRCFRIIGQFQVYPVIGPLIIAVSKSFMPMMGMFAFMGIVLCSFSFVFLIFRDDDRSVFFVLVYLFQMLVLSDRDAAEAISGLDIVHEQTKDFNAELYTGGGSQWLLMASSAMALGGMMIFSLVLLNITIGMYTNYYDQVLPLAEVMFKQHRAMCSFCCMLTPAWQAALWCRSHVEYAPRRYQVRLVLAAACCIICCGILIFINFGPITPALFLSSAIQCLKIAILIDVVEDGDLFLWSCYRADYVEDFYRDDEVVDIQREVSELRSRANREFQRILQKLK